MEIAEVVSTRATCERLKVGCVIVKNKNIVSTGYNGSIHGHPHCIDEGVGCLLNDEGRCIRTIHAFCSLTPVYDNVYDTNPTFLVA